MIHCENYDGVAAGCRVKREKMRVRKDQEGRLLGSRRKDVVYYGIGKRTHLDRIMNMSIEPMYTFRSMSRHV